MGNIKAEFTRAAEKFEVIEAKIKVRLVEAGLVLRIGLGNVAESTLRADSDPGEGELSNRRLDVLHTSASAAHVVEEEVVDMYVVAPVVPVSCPDVHGRLA